MMTAVLGLVPSPVPAEGPAVASRYSKDALAHLGLADRYAEEGQHFLAAKEYRQAIALGLDTSDVRLKLSLALYGLGLVDEAITEINKAQSLAPDANFLHLPMGVLHFAGGDLQPAEQYFVKALLINPGCGDAYFYLGEVYFRKGDYQRAWLCCRMAQTLSHPGGDILLRKLEAVSAAPAVIPWREEPDVLHLRLITVSSQKEAQALLDRMAAGELFENIAEERGSAASQGYGGYAGAFSSADLEPTIAKTLLARSVFAPPLALQAQGGYQIAQRIAPFDPSYWDQLMAPSGKAASVAAVSAKTADPVTTEGTRYQRHTGSFDKESPLSVAKATPVPLAEPTIQPKQPGALPETPASITLPLTVAPLSVVSTPLPEAAFKAPEPSPKATSSIAEAERYRESPPPVIKPTPVPVTASIIRPEHAEPLPGKVSSPGQPPAAAPLPVVPILVPEAASKAPAPSPKGTLLAAEVEAVPVMPTVTPPKPPSSTAEPTNYYRLHAGSFGTENAARKRVAELKALGFASYLFAQETSAGSYHVVAGRYASRQEATAAAAELERLKIDHYVGVAKGRFKESPPPVAEPTPAPVAELTVQPKQPEALPGTPASPGQPPAAAPLPVEPTPVPEAASKAPAPLPKATSSAAEVEAVPVMPTVTPPKPLLSPAEPANYYRLHVGSFDSENAARKRVAELKALGFPSYLFAQETAAGSYHVVAGRYASWQEATEAAAELERLKIDHYVGVAKGRYNESPPPVAEPTPAPVAELTVQSKQPEALPGKPSSPGQPPAAAPLPVVPALLPGAAPKAPEPSPKATLPTAEVKVMQTVTPPKPQLPLADTAVYYLVHAGSYAMEASANSRVEALRQHGFVSYMFHKETAAGSFHVVAGKYASRQEAKAASAQLAALGIESYISESNQRRGNQIPPMQPEAATVTSVPSAAKSSPQAAAPSIYRIMAGSYFTDSDARRQVETLQQSGFPSYMFQKETPSGRSFHVVAGKFINRPDAETAMTKLKTLGIDHYLSEGK